MKINGNPDGGGVITYLSVTSNGIYTPASGVDGFAPVEVDVPIPSFVTETLSVTSNGTYTPASGVDGYSQVMVEVPTTGYTEINITEGVSIVNLNNSASYVGPFALCGHSELRTVSLPNCTSICSSAFQQCYNLQTVNLPNCIHVGKYNPYLITDAQCFEYCSTLTYVSLPVCVELGASTFRSCIALSSIDLPNCLSINIAAFQYCYALSTVHLSVCTVIENNVFGYCSALTGLWIYTPSVCSLNGNRVFNNTNNVMIYVPASLVDTYKSATNWSSMASRIFAIE
jgi:hypothetical protein